MALERNCEDLKSKWWLHVSWLCASAKILWDNMIDSFYDVTRTCSPVEVISRSNSRRIDVWIAVRKAWRQRYDVWRTLVPTNLGLSKILTLLQSWPISWRGGKLITKKTNIKAGILFWSLGNKSKSAKLGLLWHCYECVFCMILILSPAQLLIEGPSRIIQCNSNVSI